MSLCAVMTLVSCQSTKSAGADSYALDSQIGIVSSLAGRQAATNGWADRANKGSGLTYAASVLVIDDA